MKKFISILLIIIALISAFSLNAFAAELNDDFYIKAENYAREKGIIIDHFYGDMKEGEIAKNNIKFYFNSSALAVFSICDEWNEDTSCVIKNYQFTGHAYSSADCGLCVYDGEDIYKISDAVDKKIVSVEFLADVIPDTKKLNLQTYSEQFRPAVLEYVNENNISVKNSGDVDSFINVYSDTESCAVFSINDTSSVKSEIKLNNSFYVYTLVNSSFSKEKLDAGFCVYHSGKVYKLTDAVEKNIISAGNALNNIPCEKADSDKLSKDDFESIIMEYAESLGAADKLKDKNLYDIYKHTEDVIVFKIWTNDIWQCTDVAGEYRFSTGTRLSEDINSNRTGYCVMYNKKIYTLREAVRNGIVTADELAEWLPDSLVSKADSDSIIYFTVLDYLNENGLTKADARDYIKIYKDDKLTLIYGSFGIGAADMITGGKFGDYYISSGGIMSPYRLGYYVIYPEYSSMYTLREAYDKKLSGVEDLFKNGYIGRRLGDANNDKRLNIQDVTAIQKYIAKIKMDNAGDVFYGVFDDNNDEPFGKNVYISDFNGDGKIDINDATAIQKYLAKLK